VTGDPVQWISTFREELRLLLGDVDRVGINININCDLQNPKGYRPKMRIDARSPSVREGEKQFLVTAVPEDTDRAEEFLHEMRNQGFPFEQYHAPHSFSYFLQGQAYLGTIFLWRDVAKPSISQGTIELIEALEPFVVYILSDVVARYRYADPNMGMLDAIQFMVTDSALSKQEHRVVILQLFGHSYKEMADLLGVTVDGVKHHLKMIHRKTGTRSSTELFAKYFLPRLNLENPEE